MNCEDIKLDKYAFCITCNLNRYKYFAKCFQSVGLEQPRIFPGIRHQQKGYEGCRLSHMGLMMMARTCNFPYIVIYEDDAYPRKNVIEKFNDILNDLNNHHISWNMLSLGRNGEFSGHIGDPELFWVKYKTTKKRNSLHSNAKNVTDKIIDIPRNPNGSHAYIVKRECFNEWLYILTYGKFVDICMGSSNFTKNRILWTKELLFCQKQIDNNSMTVTNSNLQNPKFIYPYNYNRDFSGVCNIFNDPPIGFDKEIVTK